MKNFDKKNKVYELIKNYTKCLVDFEKYKLKKVAEFEVIYLYINNKNMEMLKEKGYKDEDSMLKDYGYDSENIEDKLRFNEYYDSLFIKEIRSNKIWLNEQIEKILEVVSSEILLDFPNTAFIDKTVKIFYTDIFMDGRDYNSQDHVINIWNRGSIKNLKIPDNLLPKDKERYRKIYIRKNYYYDPKYDFMLKELNRFKKRLIRKCMENGISLIEFEELVKKEKENLKT